MLTLRPILLPRHLASAVPCRPSDPVLKLAGLQWEQHLVEEAVCREDRKVEGEEEKMEVREEGEGTKWRKRKEERGKKDEEEKMRKKEEEEKEEKGKRKGEKERGWERREGKEWEVKPLNC